MIKIEHKIKKRQENFWNNCLFHPTDAVEDSWGKAILDKMAADKSVKTIRIYAMLEDIVYLDMQDRLQYDFRANDLRLDYLIEQGFDLLIAYAAMPDAIAESTKNKTSVSFNKTRYKGKMFNTSIPKDYSLWEEVCYQYTKHLVERYGIERVSGWRMQCFNEPDISEFFMSDRDNDDLSLRVGEYCKLYDSFARGIGRVSQDIKVGGPALALSIEVFLKEWLLYVKENKIKLDFISYHNYGCLGFIYAAELKVNALSVENHFNKHQRVVDTLKQCGFEQLPIIIDEWGAVGGGFKNITQVPELIFRETEVFSAYFAKLIYRYVNSDYKIEKLMICLSGQHEMQSEFTGFRGFFTLNNAAKPIYNAHLLAARLKENILESHTDNPNLYVVPTVDDKGNYAILVSYSDDSFGQELPSITESLDFDFGGVDGELTLWCIDKSTTNPYRLYEKMQVETPSCEQLAAIKEEGRLKPLLKQSRLQGLELRLTPNCLYLITAEN